MLKQIFYHYFRLKILIYKKILSNNQIQGEPKIFQPTLFLGQGKISIANSVFLGIEPSPFLYSTYTHIEARNSSSSIKIGNDTFINNNATIISEGASITIGKNCLIGPNFTCFDSDFHQLEPNLRLVAGTPKSVFIDDNVFIGSNVMILKGVKIGKNCVIGGGVVTKSFPDNCIIAGNPAKIIKTL